MSLDPFLLAKARAGARTLRNAERAIEPLREDYHASIRALSAGGASLREIAAALGLSHQRVHQLVQGEQKPKATGVQAQAAPREAAAVSTCALCGEADVAVGAGLSVCAGCRETGRILLAGSALDDDHGLRLVRRHQRPHCLGCGRQPGAGELFLAGAKGAVCADCLASG